MKLIELKVIDGRYVLKLFGVKVLTHKKSMIKKNCFVLIKQNGERVYNPKIKGLTVNFMGGYNIVKLYEPLPYFNDVVFNLRYRNKIEIKGSKNVISKLCIDSMYNSKVDIDENFSSGGGLFVADHNTKIKIGKDCMFSSYIYLKTSDGHILYDTTKEQFITPKDIIIGDHVWVGAYAKILKGSVIPNNCIVGLNALVTKKFDTETSTIGGNPARVLKTGVLWDRDIYWQMKKLKKEQTFLDKFRNK